MFPIARRSILFSGGWTPAQLGSSLVAWYDASDISTLFQDSSFTTPVTADSDPVGGWKDKSINGNHLTQATADLRPLYQLNQQNGLPAIKFDGTDDYLQASFTLAQPEHVFSVAAWHTGAPVNTDTIFDGAVANAMRHYADDDSENIFTGTVLQGPAHGSTGVFYTRTCLFNSTSSSIARNGTVAASGNAGSASGSGVTLAAFGNGAANFGKVLFGELFIVNKSIDPGKATKYLRNKWRHY